ncbi:MAG: DUF47 family protein [Oscillospiraceae bacterium]
MSKKAQHNYFNMFVDLVDFSCQAAINLHVTLNNYDSNALVDTMALLHEIEHKADIGKHELLAVLATEFIPPIEREDIVAIANEIDDVTDTIEDVLLRMYMFNITEIREDALQFSTLIVQCCEALKRTMEEFHNFKKSKLIHNYIVDVNRLEEDADKLYLQAVHSLFIAEDMSPVEIFSWEETFNRMEKCCDACEHVSTLIESVIMKNS